MPGLAAGRLRHRVEIWRYTDTPLSGGRPGYDRVWKMVRRVPAEVIGQSGREAVIDRSLQGVSSFRITIRWRADLSTEDQLRLKDGRTLAIRSMEADSSGSVWWSILADTQAQAMG